MAAKPGREGSDRSCIVMAEDQDVASRLRRPARVPLAHGLGVPYADDFIVLPLKNLPIHRLDLLELGIVDRADDDADLGPADIRPWREQVGQRVLWRRGVERAGVHLP